MPPKSTEKPAPDKNSSDKPAEKSADKTPAEPKAADTRPPEAIKLAAARQRDLEAAISSITKAYGEGSIMRLGDARTR